MDCIFCKIVSGEIPSYKVFENDQVLAFLDVHPCSKGHTVVIPKKHVSEIGEIESADWNDLMSALKQVAALVDEKIKPDGMNIGINNRRAAGQAVPHVHWHIIPRFENDGGGSMHVIVRNGKPEEVADLAKIFK